MTAESSAAFSPGTSVRLKARPDVVGVITAVHAAADHTRVDVFHDNSLHEYFADQIEAVQLKSPRSGATMSKLARGLTAQLLNDTSSDYLRARHAGRIDYEPYQFRPVLKMVHADRPRILVADDVGVGKTIEACLIIKELQARQRAQRVLIVCPKPLVVDDKWRSELKRFGEDFVHLDGPTLRFCIEETQREGAWPARYSHAIVPYSLLDERLLHGSDRSGGVRQPGLIDIAPQPQFDLVIVDEAHHIRNGGVRANCVERFIDSAEAVVFLSATPLQTESNDLFTLVELLRDDLVPTKQDFQQMLEPNQHLYTAAELARAGADDWQRGVRDALDLALATQWGTQVLSVDPRVAELRDLLQATQDEPRTRVRAIRTLEDLNTFSAIVTRTRRRDIGDFTTRKPSSPTVEFTDDQSEIYEAVVDLARRIVAHQTPGMPVEFLLSMLRRQAASSISALGPLVQQVLENRLGVQDTGDLDPDELNPAALETQLRQDIADLGRRAALLDGAPDPKLDVLQDLVNDKQRQPNNKVLLFSTFRHTLAYLHKEMTDWNIRVGVMHGDIPDADRHHLRRRFKLPRTDPDAIDVMLCSEVGTEGLDYQFCDMLINYDIPWNPMRIEQRIGRIDRRGQQSESVAIINLLTEGTVEADIYQRCLLRIGVFHRAIGGSEAILGEITTELRQIADDLAMTDTDRADRLKQLADNQLARIEELARLEDAESSLLGLTGSSFADRVDDASSPWLDTNRMADVVLAYLHHLMAGRRIVLRAGRPATIRLTEQAAATMRDDLDAIGGDAALQRLLQWPTPTLQVTVDQQLAADDTTIELLEPTHPLVRMAVRHAALDSVPTVPAQVRSDAVPPGQYPIVIYAWTELGTRDATTLRYISTDPAVEAAAETLLAHAEDTDLEPAAVDESPLDQRHHDQWTRERSLYVARGRAAAERRVASLTAQRDRRLANHDAAPTVTDPRILTMRQAQRAGIVERYDKLIAQQAHAATGSELVTNKIAIALVEVVAP